MKKFKFYKEPSGEWYIDLPEWEGAKADLQMVCGADAMLELLAEGRDVVNAYISEDPFEGADELCLIWFNTIIGSGADYRLKKIKGIEVDKVIWLCDVTKYVFGKFPEKIYISAITE